jgi:hypothetical protein
MRHEPQRRVFLVISARSRTHEERTAPRAIGSMKAESSVAEVYLDCLAKLAYSAKGNLFFSADTQFFLGNSVDTCVFTIVVFPVIDPGASDETFQ